MRKLNKEPIETGNELKEAIELLEKEKNISKDSLLDAIQNSLISACKNNYGTADNIEIYMDRDTCKYKVLQKKTVTRHLQIQGAPEKNGDRRNACEPDDGREIHPDLPC